MLRHPLTVGLTVVALILWLNQLVQAGIVLAAGQPPDLLGVVLTTLLLILAQLGPRLAPRLWRRWREMVTSHVAREELCSCVRVRAWIDEGVMAGHVSSAHHTDAAITAHPGA